MASIFTKEEKPTVQTGLELTESLHESKKCVIKRVPWTEMVLNLLFLHQDKYFDLMTTFP